MKKLNKAQKKHIKDIFKKVLNITCYILSAICVLTYLIVGLQSCKSAQSTHAESETLPRYIYSAGNSVTLSVEQQTFLSESDIECDEPVSYPAGMDYHYDVYYDADYYIIYDDELYECNGFRVRYGVYWWGYDDENYFRVDEISFDYANTGFHNLLEKHLTGDSDANDFNYDCVMSRVSVYGYDLSDIPVIQLLFTQVDNTKETFIFNKVFNYNAPLGTTIGGAYGDASFDSAGENMRYINIDCGYFYSNGQLFNQIQYWAIQSAGNTILSNVNGTTSPTSAPSGYWIYSFIYYRNTITEDEVLVNYHEQLPLGQTTKYYNNASVWINDSFRYITFLEPLDEENRLIINSFNNNNQTAYYGNIGSDDITNIFSLIGSAFSSWLPILSMSILPSVTIGMLLFIPLVAMLVFAIIRIIKK